MNDNLHTAESAADYLGVSVLTIRKWLRDGKLKGSKLPNGSYRITQQSLNELINKA